MTFRRVERDVPERPPQSFGRRGFPAPGRADIDVLGSPLSADPVPLAIEQPCPLARLVEVSPGIAHGRPSAVFEPGQAGALRLREQKPPAPPPDLPAPPV